MSGRRRKQTLTLPSGKYRRLGTYRSATVAARVAHKRGAKWTYDAGRFAVVEKIEGEGGSGG